MLMGYNLNIMKYIYISSNVDVLYSGWLMNISLLATSLADVTTNDEDRMIFKGQCPHLFFEVGALFECQNWWFLSHTWPVPAENMRWQHQVRSPPCMCHIWSCDKTAFHLSPKFSGLSQFVLLQCHELDGSVAHFICSDAPEYQSVGYISHYIQLYPMNSKYISHHSRWYSPLYPHVVGEIVNVIQNANSPSKSH